MATWSPVITFFGEMKHENNWGRKTNFGPIWYGKVYSALVALID